MAWCVSYLLLCSRLSQNLELKHQTFTISHSLWGSGIQIQFSWVVLTQSPTWGCCHVSSRASVSWGSTSWGPTSRIAQEASLCATPWGCSVKSSTPRARKRKSKRAEVGSHSVFYNLTLEVTFHHFCQNLLVTQIDFDMPCDGLTKMLKKKSWGRKCP